MTPRERCMDVRKWRHAVLASGISASAKVVAIVLYEHMDWRGPNAGGNCWPSLETIATEGGMNKATVARGLTVLDGAGFIVRDRSKGGRVDDTRGRPTSYFATLPQQSQSATVGAAPRPELQQSQSASQQSQSATANSRDMRHNHPLPPLGPSASSSRVPTDVETRDDDASLQRPTTNGELPDSYEDMLDELRPLTTKPFKLGMRAAELYHDGADIAQETFISLLHDLFGRDGPESRQAWAGYHRNHGHRYTSKYCEDCGQALEPTRDGSLVCAWCVTDEVDAAFPPVDGEAASS